MFSQTIRYAARSVILAAASFLAPGSRFSQAALGSSQLQRRVKAEKLGELEAVQPS